MTQHGRQNIRQALSLQTCLRFPCAACEYNSHLHSKTHALKQRFFPQPQAMVEFFCFKIVPNEQTVAEPRSC